MKRLLALAAVLMWAGATLHAPHRAMAVQRGIEPSGVFIAFFMYGSPASRYKLWAGRRITEIDGIPVADLDAFIRAVSGRPDGASLRLKTVSWNDSRVYVDLLRKEVETAPVYDPNVPLERPIETRLYQHYRRPAYWDEEQRRR